ncbi:MAG TPA: hypothetical protein VLL08_24700 [Kineosporiaceae bacterium]|nr:hypothetical protein [Kineosporiaceae bacterium]
MNARTVSGAAACLALTATVALGGCGHRGVKALSPCEKVEATQYPRLEQVVTDYLADLTARQQRYSRCEDQGVPGAFLWVTITRWGPWSQDVRRAVFRHLMAQGWTSQAADWKTTDDARQLTSPNQTFEISIVASRDFSEHFYPVLGVGYRDRR